MSFSGAGIVPAEETPPKVEKQVPIDWFQSISMVISLIMLCHCLPSLVARLPCNRL